jgi:hypothetical protein
VAVALESRDYRAYIELFVRSVVVVVDVVVVVPHPVSRRVATVARSDSAIRLNFIATETAVAMRLVPSICSYFFSACRSCCRSIGFVR